MLKFLSVFLAAVMLLGLCACSPAVSDTSAGGERQIEYIRADSSSSEAYLIFTSAFNKFLNGTVTAKNLDGSSIGIKGFKKADGTAGIDSFALYDVTNDGLPELLIKSDTVSVIAFTNTYLSVLFSEDTEYETTSILRSGAVFSSHKGTGTEYRYTSFKNSVVVTDVFFDAESDDEYAPYVFNERTVTKSDFGGLTSKYFSYAQEIANIEWFDLERIRFANTLYGENEAYQYVFKDVSGDKREELIVFKDKVLTVYGFDGETPTTVGTLELNADAVRFMFSEKSTFYGIFTCTVNGDTYKYGYVTVNYGQVIFDELWEKNITSGAEKSISEYNSLITESKLAQDDFNDIPFIHNCISDENAVSFKVNSKTAKFVIDDSNGFTVINKSTMQTVQQFFCTGEKFSSRCAYAVDLDFDGNLDIVIPYSSSDSAVYFSAYVWHTDNNKFVYASGFREIPNFSTDRSTRQILSTFSADKNGFYGMYTYDSAKNEFTVSNLLRWEPADSEGTLRLEETSYYDSKKAVLKKATVACDESGAPAKTDATVSQYFSENSFWDLGGEKWQTPFYKENQ